MRMEHPPESGTGHLPPQSAQQGETSEHASAIVPPAASAEGTQPPHPPGRAATIGSADSSGTERKGFLVFGWISVGLGIIVLVARILLVRIGVLYGTSPVSQVNAIAGALVVIGFVLISSRNAGKKGKRRNRGTEDSVEGGDNTGQGWAAWASGATALVAAGALVVSLTNLVEPLNPPNLAMSACPGARDKNVKYVGIATGVDGVNSRQGPALSYLPDGRFPQGCSIGFSAYCLGDPIGETGGTSAEIWVTSRWLLIAKHTDRFFGTLAHFLSGENPESQFITDAFITPETSYDDLPFGSSSQCRGGFPYPGKANLSTFNARASTFTAVALHATNMGFAVWVPSKQGFQGSDTYSQLPSLSSSPTNNPGKTAADGSKSVKWDYQDTLLPQLKHSAANTSSSLGNVVIMAVACLAVNIPARTSTAALAVYQLSKTRPPLIRTNFPKGLNESRLARAACEAGS